MMMRLSPAWPVGLVIMCVLATGCRAPWQIQDPEYAGVADAVAQAAMSRLPAVESLPPVTSTLEGPQPVEVFVEFALSQNPDIQAARKWVDASAHRVPQAASLKDPMFGITTFPEPVQTAAGEQDIRLTASQQLPWFGKLSARATVAEEDTNVARAQLAASELEVIERVKRVYYELYFLQKAIEITEQSRKLLLDLTRIAESKYRTGTVSQQDVLRAQVEVSNTDTQLILLRQQIDSSQATLARLLHVSPDTPLRALEELPEQQIPRDLDLLYAQAIETRPELHAQLAAVQRDQYKVELARLNYFPDVTAGVTWIGTGESGISPGANGRDAVLLGVSMNVPLYRKRLQAGVREAEAVVVSGSRTYDSMRDRTTEQVKDLFVRATSQEELVRLFKDDIIPKSEQTLKVSRSAYQVGDVDFLQLIDNWQQLLRFQINYHRLESQLRQTLATLQRVVGGELRSAEPNQPAPQPPENE